ncbi:hypothetical protein QWY87_02970 [Lutimonas halocynthiae]|uniref:hypothetical protein n=1 Tax=Lutimonas halocynthiae TaxID=1446477 RepID=UPI0025B54C83|nr:hypothetical protein [Lutimonas halocynthiae]MDN3641647.1 hypothetical protein [Lutimonas halocynthiae]
MMIILWGEFSPIRGNLIYKLGAGGHAFTRLKEVKQAKNIDILFLGSSHTFRGFDTRIFNKKYNSFNLGTNSQTPIQTEYLLNRHLDSLNPKIIFLEICPLILSSDGIESTLEILSNVTIDPKITEFVFEQNHLKVYNTYFYAVFNDFVLNRVNNFSEKNKVGNSIYIKNGFEESELKNYKKMYFQPSKWHYSKKQFMSLERILNLAREKNIQIILVQAPVTSDYYNSIRNNNEFDFELSKYGKYYNFNEILELNDTIHFLDYHHLNQGGVESFNNQILKILEELEVSNNLN